MQLFSTYLTDIDILQIFNYFRGDQIEIFNAMRLLKNIEHNVAVYRYIYRLVS